MGCSEPKLFVDGQRAAMQRFGLGRTVHLPKQRGQVVEALGDVGSSGP